MKKTVRIMMAVIWVLIISAVTYFYVWGGKPQIENFAEVSDEYTVVAKLALDTYSEISPAEEHITVFLYDGGFRYDNSELPLTEEQKNAVLAASENFDCLSIYKDAVFFREDETGYYGLVYAEQPLYAIYREGLPQVGRRYHRINSHWYEWGVWGI